jgi:UDP-glucose 4-epimerase
VRVLVTGASGFLGGHVVQRLLADGAEVTAFDQHPYRGDGVRCVVGNLLEVDELAAAVAGQDAVCHIGAIGDVYLAASQPALAASVNVTGSANVAEAARRAGARVVYASTWEVYGHPERQPIDEDHPCKPDHPYNITKLAGERMLLAADRLHDVPVIALRLGTAYGSGLRPNSVFRIFIDKASRGETITIQGDGAQSRQFTHAHDIARAFSLAAHSQMRNVALNIVAQESVSIRYLADCIVGHFPTEVQYGEPRPGDVASAIVSSERAAALLGWRAEVPFESGISKLVEDARHGRE